MTRLNSRSLIVKLLCVVMALFVIGSVSGVTAFADDTTTSTVTTGTSTDTEISFEFSITEDITAFDAYLESDKAANTKYQQTSKTENSSKIAIKDVIGGTSGTYTFNDTVFNSLEQKSQQALVTDLMRELKDSKYSATATQEFTDALSDMDSNISKLLIPFVFDDLNADMATAYKWVAPVLSVLRVILGVLAIAVLLLLVLSTIVDCCFIGLPVAREALTKGDNNGGAISGHKKPPFVSYDAIKTINETESHLVGSGEYKNPFGVYFKRRIVTYIILALCLFYLVAGEMSGLISWLLSMVSGVTG